jgi:hypothetical protein
LPASFITGTTTLNSMLSTKLLKTLKSGRLLPAGPE